MNDAESPKWYQYHRTAGTRLAGPWFLARADSAVLLNLVRLPEIPHAIVALLPIPGFGWFLWGYIRHILALDELRHRIELEGLATAFPLSVAHLMFLGQLELA